MSDYRQLKKGDRIRIICVPQADRLAFDAGAIWLAETLQMLQWMVGKEYPIAEVDSYGIPWVEMDDYMDPGGGLHSMAITDDDSWLPA